LLDFAHRELLAGYGVVDLGIVMVKRGEAMVTTPAAVYDCSLVALRLVNWITHNPKSKPSQESPFSSSSFLLYTSFGALQPPSS
jgi:hypothetical protein